MKGRFWIAFVVGLLVTNAVAMGAMIAQAGDPTPRVLPDYYKKAVAFDETIAERRASAELGWVATVTRTGRDAQVVLADAAGAPVAGAAVDVTIRPRSRADRLAAVTLTEAAPGRYAAAFAPGQRGLHEIEVRATRGAERFVTTAVTEP